MYSPVATLARDLVKSYTHSNTRVDFLTAGAREANVARIHSLLQNPRF